MDDLFGPIAVQTNSAAGYQDEEYESVLFVARECFVYKVPPRSSTAGYKAAEWVCSSDWQLYAQRLNLATGRHGGILVER